MNSEIRERIEQINEGIVPEGYKKTKIGIYPKEWEEKQLKQISLAIGGGTPKTSCEEFWIGEIPWISSSDIKEDNIFEVKPTRFINNEAIDKSAAKLIPKDSIAVVTRVGVGKIAYIPFRYSTSQDFQNLINITENKIFLVYYLSKELEKISEQTQGTSIKGITKKTLGQIKVVLPGINEQETIANILSTWDKAIEKIEKFIKEKEIQKKGLMQQLLTGETRLPGFSGEWEEVKLGDIGEIRTSSVNKKIKNDEKNILLLNYMDVYNNKYIDSEIEFMEVTATGHQIKTNNLVIGDILFTPSSETRDDIGHSSVVIENIKDLLYSYHLVRYRLKSSDSMSLAFKGYCFNNEEILKKFSRLATGSTRYTLSKADFESIKFKLPPLPEQEAIANILSTADKEIELLKELLQNKKQEKKGLMQLLLTGIVRV